MWYWVKSPGGDQNDYNLQELKRALQEGPVQPDWMGRRNDESDWYPVEYLVKADDEGQEKREPPPAQFISLQCGKCKQTLQIKLPIAEAAYVCPQCHTSYKAKKVADSPLTYVLMPAWD